MSSEQRQGPASPGMERENPQQNGEHGEHAQVSRRGAMWVLVFILLLAAVLAMVGILHRREAARQLARDTNEAAIPEVQALLPQQGSPTQEIMLPGNIQAFEDAPLYARTNGYLKKWYFDIGARVRKGQLIATIESPEVDQQLQQALADLATAKANLQLAQTTAARYTDLLKSDSVSRQSTDTFVSSAEANKAIVASAQANVNRLEQLQSFENIVAPFDGVITARNTDVGQLIDAGSSSTGSSTTVGNSAAGSSTANARELFHIASIRVLRVYINVPQIYSRNARPGTVAYLTLNQYPGRKFKGKIVRNANAIELSTRTLLTEIDIDNPTGELLPGAYTEVHLKLDIGMQTTLIPVSALIFRADGLQVATLDNQSHARLVSITVGRDYGTQVEVVSGIAPGQRVVDNPPDSLADGDAVRVVHSQNTSAMHPPAQQPRGEGQTK